MKVFITGASSGIGAALARHYAAQGAVLGLAARRLEPMQALAAELAARHRTECVCHAADVAQPEQMRAAAEAFLARFGAPDLVIANAGVNSGTQGSEADDLPKLGRMLAVNVLGLAASFQPFIAPMRERASGTLAGIASVAGFRGLPGGGAYSSSKAAAIAWLEALRVELRGSGIAVVTLCPGYIRTPMTASNPYPMPFLLEPEEAARRFARAIAARRRVAVIPWPMALAAIAFRHLPGWLYDRVFARAPHKPRGLPL